MLPEQRTASPLKCVQQEEVKTSRVNLSTVVDKQLPDSSVIIKENPPSMEINQSAPHNTLYDSEMEMTVVDSAAEIVTVQTKPRRHCDKDENLCQDKRKSSVTSRALEDEACHLKDVTLIESGETQLQESMSLCTSVCSRENENLPPQPEPLWDQKESVTFRRKTRSTFRSAKSNKRCNSQKLPALMSDPRKTYIVTPLSCDSTSNSNDLDDFFTDTEAQSQSTSKSSTDGHFSKEKRIQLENKTEKLQNERAELRKTFVIPEQSKPKQSRKTKVSLLPTDLFQESAVLFDSFLHDIGSTAPSNSLDELQTTQKEKPSRKRSTKAQQPSMMKKRATYVVNAIQNTVSIDTVNETIDVLDKDIADEQQQTESQLTDPKHVQLDDCNMLKDAPCSENSVAIKEKHTAERIKPKKIKTGEIKKAKKKFATARENVSVKTRTPTSSSNQKDIRSKIPVLSHGVKENCISNDSVQLPLEKESHCPAFEGAVVNHLSPETERTSTVHTRNLNHKDWGQSHDTGTTSEIVIPRHLGTQSLKSISREAFVVKTSRKPGKGNTLSFNSSFEQNRQWETSGLSECGMFVPNQSHDSQSTPRKTDRLGQTHSELFDDESPPWESHDLGSSQISTCHSPVNKDRESQGTLRTVDTHEESDLNSTHHSGKSYLYVFELHPSIM